MEKYRLKIRCGGSEIDIRTVMSDKEFVQAVNYRVLKLVFADQRILFSRVVRIDYEAIEVEVDPVEVVIHHHSGVEIREEISLINIPLAILQLDEKMIGEIFQLRLGPIVHKVQLEVVEKDELGNLRRIVFRSLWR